MWGQSQSGMGGGAGVLLAWGALGHRAHEASSPRDRGGSWVTAKSWLPCGVRTFAESTDSPGGSGESRDLGTPPRLKAA